MDCFFQTCMAGAKHMNLRDIGTSTRGCASLGNSNPDGPQRGREAMDLPEDVHVRGNGRKKALMIGCNYTGTKAELRGCINDVRNLKKMLSEVYGFQHSDITTMTDEDMGSRKPTKANVLAACRELVSGAERGDVFFFSYSGHGGQQDDAEGFEEDGMNETLIPLDYQEVGMITDDELNSILVSSLPSGCKLTVFFDACHSGTGLDLPYHLVPSGWCQAVNPLHSEADVVMISGCMDEQTSADAMINGSSTGALTHSLLEVLSGGADGLTYVDLLQRSHKILDRGNYTQRPVFTSNQPFNLDREFTFDMICPNKNTESGRTDRERFKPAPNPNTLAFMQEIQVGGLDQVCKVGMKLVTGFLAAQAMGGGGGGAMGALGGLMGGGGGAMGALSGLMGGGGSGGGGGGAMGALSGLMGSGGGGDGSAGAMGALSGLMSGGGSGSMGPEALQGIGMSMFKKYMAQQQ